jgi:acyl-coenzyme A synthetase/AMP-(fatty) acid ligase
MHVRSAADLDDIAYTLREGIEAQILSETGEILPHSTPGILRLRSPTMATSYIGNPEATAAVFRDGWFYSGDLGSLTEDGRLRILGRTIDTFNFGGIKVNAADIDASVLRVPGVRSAMSFVQRRADGVVALSVCAVAEPAVDRVALAAAIRGSVQAFHRTLSVQRVVFADDLPLNDNGKPVRAWGGELAAGLAVY